MTQKTAWFILHKIKESLKGKNGNLLTGNKEVEEALGRGKYRKQAQEIRTDRNIIENEKKTTVIVILSREGTLKTEVMPIKNDVILNIVKKHVDTSAQSCLHREKQKK